MKNIKKWYDTFPIAKKKIYFYFLNYIINGIPVSVFFYIVMSLWLSQSLIRYVSTYIATVIFLMYFEHYYGWFRRHDDEE